MKTQHEEHVNAKHDVMIAREVAEYLRMSHKNVCTQAERGEIPGKKIGGIWRFSRKTIETML